MLFCWSSWITNPLWCLTDMSVTRASHRSFPWRIPHRIVKVYLAKGLSSLEFMYLYWRERLLLFCVSTGLQALKLSSFHTRSESSDDETWGSQCRYIRWLSIVKPELVPHHLFGVTSFAIFYNPTFPFSKAKARSHKSLMMTTRKG